jgi:site-specific DNA recombinase
LHAREVQRSAGQHDHSLAFLAPNLVKAAVEGRLPRGIGVERLRDPPTEWSRQFEALGLNPE